MKEELRKIVDAFSSGAEIEAMEMCARVIEGCQNAFMEALTVNTATDYIGIVILYCQITAKIKKPWLAIPKLEAARGALRFIDDFMSDRETVAATYTTIAESFAYAGFLPEAILYFRMCGCISENRETKENAFSEAFYYSLRFDKIEKELINSSKRELGNEVTENLIATAKKDISMQIRTDPVERSEKFLAIRYEIEEAVDNLLASDDSNDSFCMKYWRIKKKLLKDRYNIIWKSPAEMNPEIRFQ